MRTLNQIHGATNDDVSFYLSEIDVEEFRKHVAEFSGEQRTLRDWFAGMALQGLWSKTRHEDDDDSLLSFHLDVYAHHAGHCYEMADAMIAARKEGA